MIFNVRLNPKSSRTGIDGIYEVPGGEKYLKISVNAPPVDGKANTALIMYLAKILKTAKTKIKIIKGEQDRNKMVSVDNPEADKIIEELFNK